jgi:GrpE
MNILSLIHTEALGFAPGIDWTTTLVLLGVVAVLIFGAGTILGRHVPSRPRPDSVTPPQGQLEFKTLAAQRKALVGGSVKVRGLLEDQLLTNLLDDALREGGVSLFEATGDPIDPARHRVAHTVPAPDPGADGVIAQTLAPGYADDGQIVRPADVVVYKWARS